MIDLVHLSSSELVAFVIAVTFAAGLNVSATLVTIGLVARAGLLVLPAPLDTIDSWWIISAASALFVVEVVADKIPALDLFWNGLQTFVRIPAGALLAYGATAQLSLGHQLLAAALGAVVALVAHGGKMATHTAVNLSPEPFSNAIVSVAEDATAIFLSWFATRHPFIAAAIVGVLIVTIALALGFILRTIIRTFKAEAADRSVERFG